MFSSVRLHLAIFLSTIVLLKTVAATKVPAESTLRIRSSSLDGLLSPKQRQQHPQHHTQHQQPHKVPLFDFERQSNSAMTPYTQAELDLKPCVVVRFFEEQANSLPLLLFSLLASGHPRLKALVLDTGKHPYKNLAGLLRRVNRASGRSWVHAYKKKRKDAQTAFPDFHHEDYGYILTDMALENILSANDASSKFQCDTLTFTNADNLYSPHFIPAMLKSISSGSDMVASHFVSHYNFPEERNTHSYHSLMASESGCGTLRSGPDAEFVTSDRFFAWCVDLGAVMLTTRAVAKTKLRFVIDKLRSDGSGTSLGKTVMAVAMPERERIAHEEIASIDRYMRSADGHFFHRLASNQNISTNVVRRVLLLHL